MHVGVTKTFDPDGGYAIIETVRPESVEYQTKSWNFAHKTGSKFNSIKTKNNHYEVLNFAFVTKEEINSYNFIIFYGYSIVFTLISLHKHNIHVCIQIVRQSHIFIFYIATVKKIVVSKCYACYLSCCKSTASIAAYLHKERIVLT